MILTGFEKSQEATMLCSILLTKKKKRKSLLTAIITTYRNVFLQFRHVIAVAFVLFMQTGQ